MTSVNALLPADVDDPRRPSGGNAYDRRVITGLAQLGWNVSEHQISGAWPCPDPTALEQLDSVISAIPDDTVVLADGLVASGASSVLVPGANRLRMVVLAHMPFEVPGESEVLCAARAIVATSAWARARLLSLYPLEPGAVHVAEPGADVAEVATGTCGGGELLCVASVSPHKGHDVLVNALGDVRDLAWRCRVVGSVDRDPVFAEDIGRRVDALGLTDRVTFCGALAPVQLGEAYATSDLLVHPSRGETYGMVITEALAHALPVVATDVGGVPEAMGQTAIGMAGRLIAVDAPDDLAVALRAWLTENALRSRWRAAAAVRRKALPSWQSTTTQIARVVSGLPG